jgi:nucleoside 2-deoxyribosyltransferase
MSSLSLVEREQLRDFLKMGGGYVLDLTDSTFNSLFLETLGIDVTDSKYCGQGSSKAKRLSAFWQIEDDALVAPILEQLIELAKYKDPVSFEKNSEPILSILNRLRGSSATIADSFSDIWEPQKIRLFISHRDAKKREAKALAESLSSFGISSFVAHDAIEANSSFKEEIIKALRSMDCFLSFITEDYYKSVWTNQEIGFALARNIPFFQYSYDRKDPEGFKSELQAIKKGEQDLLRLLKKEFSSHPAFKMAAIASFVAAKDGTWEGAKKKLLSILGFKFTDNEIDQIVSAINAPARYANQLLCLLTDLIPEPESVVFKVPKGTYLRELLQTQVLNQHSTKRYRIQPTGTGGYKIHDTSPDAS